MAVVNIRSILSFVGALLALHLVDASLDAGMTLRVRLQDGSIERIQIPSGADKTLSLNQVISRWTSKTEEKHTLQVQSTAVEDSSLTIAELGLKHGSLISIVPTKKTVATKESATQVKPEKEDERWDPFPDIAKDYGSVRRKTKVRRSQKSGMSYSDIANLQSSFHKIEPQQEGSVKRLYMCHLSAARFQSNCLKKDKIENRVGLLLGSITRERAEPGSKGRTSLHSQTEKSKYCQVAKVQALWEPSLQRSSKEPSYSVEGLLDDQETSNLSRVLKLAKMLGMRPVGWIFTYTDQRQSDEDSLPVHSFDAKNGASLQIMNMKQLGRAEGSQFVTVSMEAKTGASEAFQLSDVCVQMIAEDIWEKADGRFVNTKHSVIVDGAETQRLDAVLCLVNTAMLSHEGKYAGRDAGSSVKKSGALTNKSKKALLSCLDKNDDFGLLERLCDFNLLLALDNLMSKESMEEMCKVLSKWASGFKRGVELGSREKLNLRTAISE